MANLTRTWKGWTLSAGALLGAFRVMSLIVMVYRVPIYLGFPVGIIVILSIYPESIGIWTGTSELGIGRTLLLSAILFFDAFLMAGAFGAPIYLFLRAHKSSDLAG